MYEALNLSALQEGESAYVTEVNAPPARPPQPVNILALQTALAAYSELSRQNKKEFWGRIVGQITITNDDHFFVTLVRHI